MRSSTTSNTALLLLWFFTVSMIALLSVFGRKIQVFIASGIELYWIAVIVIFLLVCVLLFLLKNRKKNRIRKRVLLLSSLLLISGGGAVYLKFLAPVEAVHFLIFSCLGWLSSAVFGTLYGALAVSTVAVGDEVLQYYLPSRVGDLHDVVINLISGFAGVLLKGK